MENYEKNRLPEYIGAVVALTALLMGYCTFSPMADSDVFTAVWAAKYAATMIITIVVIGVIVDKRDTAGELATALISFMIAAVADRIGWYSYIIVAAMALGEAIWLAAGVHKRKKDSNGSYKEENIKEYWQDNAMTTVMAYLVLALFIVALNDGNIPFLNKGNDTAVYEVKEEEEPEIVPEALTLVIEPDYEYVKEYDSYDNEGRLKALGIIYANEQKGLGLENTASIQLAELETDLPEKVAYGDYSHEDRFIRINKDYLDDFDVTLNTLLHEMMHQYQSELVDTGIADASRLAYFDDIREYKKELYNYKSTYDGCGFSEYYEQKVEADARQYADERTEFYKQILERD